MSKCNKKKFNINKFVNGFAKNGSECIINDQEMIPLPGTYQNNKLVKVV